MNKNVVQCLFCGSSELETLVEIEKYHYLVRPTEFENVWRHVPLKVGLCRSCGTSMQLAQPNRETLDEIYSKYYGSYPSFASDSETEERHNEFLEFITSSGVSLSGHALEIGSFDGRFLAKLQSAGMTVHGCDPNRAAAAEAKRAFGIETTLEYFTPETFAPDSFDLVSARLVLEHADDPDRFLAGLQRIVRDGGHVALEVPDCGSLMAEGAAFWMVEHLTYFTATSFLRALRRRGFDGTVTSHNGILRAVGRKMAAVGPKADDVAQDVALALDFRKRYRDYVGRYDAILAEARERRWPIAVYGIGNYFTNLLSSTSLDPAEIVAICDGNPKKWGVELAGLGLKVQSPESLDSSAVGVVVLASQSFQGMLDRLAPYLDEGGRALLPFPAPALFQRSAGAA